MFFDEAAERARELDHMRGKGQLAGPLHGLPVSIKDTFQIVGTSATVGLVSFLHHKSAVSSPLVDMLLDLGAVVYCKTNVSQTLMVGCQMRFLMQRFIRLYWTNTVSSIECRLAEQCIRSNIESMEHESRSGRIQWWRGSTRRNARIAPWCRHRRCRYAWTKTCSYRSSKRTLQELNAD